MQKPDHPDESSHHSTKHNKLFNDCLTILYKTEKLQYTFSSEDTIVNFLEVEMYVRYVGAILILLSKPRQGQQTEVRIHPRQCQ